VTLGTLTQNVFHESTGYLAFFTTALFMIGLAMLPSETGATPLPPAATPLPPASQLVTRGT
jgi:hypothetical protein